MRTTWQSTKKGDLVGINTCPNSDPYQNAWQYGIHKQLIVVLDFVVDLVVGFRMDFVGEGIFHRVAPFGDVQFSRAKST